MKLALKKKLLEEYFVKRNQKQSQETGVNKRTIHGWIRVFERISAHENNLRSNPKIRTFLDTLNLNFELKSKYCRTHGLYIEELNA